MGLFRWLARLFGSELGGGQRQRDEPAHAQTPAAAVAVLPAKNRLWQRAKLARSRQLPAAVPPQPTLVEQRPYRFATAIKHSPTLLGRRRTYFYDRSTDLDHEFLARWNLPVFATPDELAAWLHLPIGKVAWLSGRPDHVRRPPSVRQSHYVYIWKAKRKGGARLLESPKPLLKQVQQQILREILDRVPAHEAAHGFVKGRSIRSNAVPHCGSAVILKLDLKNFYASVRYSRVTAIFRAFGYSREAALWLASLTTSNIPPDLPIPASGAHAIQPYLGRHLPQGAATSPALANLSAYALDVRLCGLAAAYGGTYTRYADDLTISGPAGFGRKLRNIIPLAEAIVRNERFGVCRSKRKVQRCGSRQSIAGVIVNEKPNIGRDEFDRLKAILHNCVVRGPAGENRAAHPDFAAHLRGRIAHVGMLNTDRGAKLLRLYEQIRF